MTSMKLLKTIDDKSLGLDTPEPEKWGERRAARAVLMDGKGKAALMYSTIRGKHKLPGGGIDEGETIEQALRREIKEETGCNIKDIRELGITEEFWTVPSAVHQISYGFLAEVDGKKGLPDYTKEEAALGFGVIWMPLAEAIKKMKADAVTDDYEIKMMTARELVFLNEAKKILNR